MKKILALLACLFFASVAQAQTTLPWGLATGANPRAPQIRDTSGTWISVGSLDSTAHQLIGFGIAGQTVYSGSYAAGTPATPGINCHTAGNVQIGCTAAQATAQMNAALAGTLGVVDLNGTTLSVNGSGGLSINLGNANTWTATQTFPANSIVLGQIAQIAANTILGNFSASTANVAAQTINGGSSCSTALTYTNGTGIGCAAGAVSSITVSPSSLFSTVTPIVSSATVFASGTQTSGFRLTLTTGVPVLISNVTAATSIILTPYVNNTIGLWNSANSAFVDTHCAEMSNVLANSSTGSAGPAAVVASGVYDLFAWNSGTLAAPTCTLTRGPAWTNSTTRSAGTALGRNAQGILTNTTAITNGPAANTGTYVGTFVADSGAGTVSWNFGGSASGGTAAQLNVWNMYNRVNFTPSVADTGVTYTYASATIRQARASTGNQINLVTGLQEDGITVAYGCGVTTAATLGANFLCAIGLNNTTGVSGPYYLQNSVAAVADSGNGAAVNYFNIAIGVTFITALESSPNATTNTYDAGAINTLYAQMRM